MMNKHLSINEAMNHIKQNVAPVIAKTFKQGFEDMKTGRGITEDIFGDYTIIAHNLGDINLTEEIVDTTLFLRQITMAMFPNHIYPVNFLKTGIWHT